MRGGIPKGGGQATRSCPNRLRWGNGYAPRSIAFKLDGRESHPQRDSPEEIHPSREPLDHIKPFVLRPYLVPSEGSKRANRYKGSEQRAFWRMAEEALGGFRGECVRLPSF